MAPIITADGDAVDTFLASVPETSGAPAVPLSASELVVAYAEVNHGRWIVPCPFPGCGSAQLAPRDDPRFCCGECLNAAVGGAWVAVEWPADAAAIEAVLELRPTPAASWSPTETVADLVAENAAHGIEGGA